MKKFIYIAIVVFFSVSLTSCGSAMSAKKASENEVTSYTLKNKKEIMERKVLHKRSKIIIATP